MARIPCQELVGKRKIHGQHRIGYGLMARGGACSGLRIRGEREDG